jgi:glycosyltransferase involved in cell wall biosynthesis
MRICHIFPFFFPHTLGGVEKWIFSLSQFLSKSTQDMHFLLLTDRSNLSPYAASAKRSQYGSLQVYRMGPNILSVIFYSSRIRWRIIERISLLQLFHEATRLPPVKRVDIFHLHGVWLGKGFKQYMELALMLSRFFNKPLVVSLHGDAIGEENMPLFNPEVKRTLNHAKAITTYSPDVFEALTELQVASKSHIIPNFIDTRSFKRSTPIDYGSATRVIFVSRLEPERDPLTVIKAFRYVKEKIPSSTLTVVGYGSMYEELQDLIHKLELDNNVILKGQHFDVRSLLWDSDIFVGVGYLTLLEAWAAGLPAVEYNWTVLRQLVSHRKNAILVPPHNPKKLAQALVELMENEQLRKELALNGMRTVKNYDIQSIAPKIGEIYSAIMKT